MSRPAIAFFASCVLITSCSGATNETTATQADSTTTSTATTSTLPDLRDELKAAEEAISELQSQLEELSDELSESERGRSEAEAAIDEALNQLDELRLAYDDEIQQVLASGVESVVDSSCSAIDEPLNESQVVELIDGQISAWADQPGLPENSDDALDREAIEEQVGECMAAAEEKAHQAQLTAPKGDGFYTIGEEIATGTWESQGSGDACYWARLDSNQDLIDNHFGDAGGRITIRSSDSEVQFSDCGTWEYQG